MKRYIAFAGGRRVELMEEADGDLLIESETCDMQHDAARWRALIASTGHETDMSSGPGKPKDMIVRINCTGVAKFLESGAVDWAGTLNAAMDDEIRLQATPPSGGDKP